MCPSGRRKEFRGNYHNKVHTDTQLDAWVQYRGAIKLKMSALNLVLNLISAAKA